MNVEQIQELSDMICKDYNYPCVPIFINKRLKQFLGLAFHREQKIELSAYMTIQPFEIILSVLIHELCHLFLKQGHTPRFFSLSGQLHKEYGIEEKREHTRSHGSVYKDGVYIPWNKKYNITAKEVAAIKHKERLNEIPD